MRNFIFFMILVFIVSCKENSENRVTDNSNNQKNKQNVVVPSFNSDSAYAYVNSQVLFGPRVPNTEAHVKCGDYLISKLKEFGADVIVQKADLKAYDGVTLKSRNIIGQFSPENNNRIMLCAHWDSRPFADHDPDESKRDLPIDGASDGASGVGILLEIARQIGKSSPGIGVDVIYFDSEDYGLPEHKNLPYKEDTWCLGSQYWSKNMHKKGYYPRYGILLDMVGAKGALFTKEGTSMAYAPGIVEKVWNTASKIGYSDYFIFRNTNPITDDHLYVNEIANIPCIDIIQYDPTSFSFFGDYWHTHNDNMDVIDKNTLKAVGQTLLEVIYNEK